MDNLIIPQPLKQGDKVVFVSPAGNVKSEFVEKAAELLRERGWDVSIAPHALGKYGTYSGTDSERFADLSAALADPDIKAIFCSRGGYGVVHLLERLDLLPLRSNPKWLIGYSDISALHALLNRHDIASIHAPMAKHLSTFDAEDYYSQALFGILEGNMPEYTLEPHPLNRPGTVSGQLIGGNLAVLADLIATPFDIFEPGAILFIEDIAEPIYKTERILYQLKLSGALGRLGGLIVGQFTDYKPDTEGTTMESMIAEIVKDYSYPVAFNVPVGHVDENLPLVESAPVTLSVTPDSVVISQKSAYTPEF
ncbi:MAG: LD-carboxypeptidase [Muribaculaceae bacterium]|nr:LD-carboxypeptidase [Muribaculaceae bacterium]